MGSIKINKLRQEVNKNLKQKAKNELKNNSKLKLIVSDIKHHFRKKDAWPLCYESYKEMTGFYSPVFNQILLLLNMKIYFCNQRQSVVFKKVSK